MRLDVAATELGAPHAAVRYVCRCGAASVQHGRHATPPEGWVRAAEGEHEDELLCPECSRRSGPGGELAAG